MQGYEDVWSVHVCVWMVVWSVNVCVWMDVWSVLYVCGWLCGVCASGAIMITINEFLLFL